MRRWWVSAMRWNTLRATLHILGITDTNTVTIMPTMNQQPMLPNVADNFVMLKPQQEWPNPERSKADLVDAMQAAVAKVPGNNYEFTQPIQMRFNELLSGVRSDVAVKVYYLRPH